MIFTILNLLAILYIGLLIIIPIKRSLLRWAISFGLGFFLVLQISSIYLGGTLIDYKFYVHFNLKDIIAMSEYFVAQIILLVLLLILFPVLVYWLRKKAIRTSLFTNRYYRSGMAVFLIIIMSLNGGVLNNIINVGKIATTTDKKFELALADLGMDDYVQPNKIIAQKGKNIIILSLESVERGYLSEKFSHLTPNIGSMAKRWNYYDMEQSSGGGWTSASLYISLTGVPAFFKGDGNKRFQNSYDSHISSVGHVLKKAGYDMTYLIGNAEFSGTKDLLKTFQITNIIDQTELGGKHDKDLFEKAKSILLSKKKEGKPFSLFMSTVDSHNPNGFYDSRMEEVIEPQNTDLEFTVASVDYMIGDFIDFLEAEDILTNTVVYIFPDHLKMGDGSMFNGTGDRSLYTITNAVSQDISVDTTNHIHQLDLPKIIISGAGIEHNVKFLVDYMQNEDKNEFIAKKGRKIATLNNSGLIRSDIWVENLSIELDDHSNAVVWFNNNEKVVSSIVLNNFVTQLRFDDGLRLKSVEYFNHEAPVPNGNNYLAVNLYLHEDVLYSYVEIERKIAILRKGEKKITYSLKDVLKTFNSLPEFEKRGMFLWAVDEKIELKSPNNKQQIIKVPYNITAGSIEIEYTTSGDVIPAVMIYDAPYSRTKGIILDKEIPKSNQAISSVKFPIGKSIRNPALHFKNESENGTVTINKFELSGYGSENGSINKIKSKHDANSAKEKMEYINDNGSDIATLNNSAVTKNNIWEEMLSIELDDTGNVVVMFNDNVKKFSLDTLNKFVTQLQFDDRLRLKNVNYFNREFAIPTETNYLAVNFYIHNKVLYSYLEKEHKVAILRKGEKKIIYSLKEVLTTYNSLPEFEEQEMFVWEGDERIELMSPKYKERRIIIPYNIIAGSIEIQYSTTGDAVPLVMIYDAPYSRLKGTVLLEKIPNSNQIISSVKFPISKSVGNPSIHFKNESEKGTFIIHKFEISGYGSKNGIKFKIKSEHYTNYAKDKNRFIAHAGGSIDGIRYTNSLEALNKNYNKGFRLFELDIIKTSDEKYVAAHDWKHWTGVTGYDGIVPVTEKEFLNHKINKKYTPLNMRRINDWFSKHPDAILVTDKVNEPAQFAKAFIDKKRLVMELFTLEALKEGISVGIKSAMASQNVFEALGNDKVLELNQLGVKEIAVSRRYIAANITLLEHLKNSGIKTYVYHVNFDEGKDEQYVVNYEMDYIYGLYADIWEFE